MGQTPKAKDQLTQKKDYDLQLAKSLLAGREAQQGEARIETQKSLQAKQDDNFDPDPYRPMRRFLFDLLRRRGEENDFKLEDKIGSRVHNLPLMPLLCGDNPLNNEAPSKFLRLTDYQLFILRQWAEGHFINEMEEGWINGNTYPVYFPYPIGQPKTGRALDRGVLGNVLGGAFCPGGEIGWVMRNPSIYWEPYRIKADRQWSDFLQSAAQSNKEHGSALDDFTFSLENPLSHDSDFSTGLQPGDLTKSMALPWQADFNECTTNPTNITYADWNEINPESENDQRLIQDEKTWDTLWWPAHRPLQSNELVGYDANGNPETKWTTWSRGIQQTNAGDFKMVTEWWKLGFIIRNPYLSAEADRIPTQGADDNRYYSIDR